MNIVCDSPVSAAFQAVNNRRSSNMEEVSIRPGQIPIRTLGSQLGYAMAGRSAVGLGFAAANDPRTKLGSVEMALDLDRMVVDGENLTANAMAMAFNTRLDSPLPSNVQTYANSMVPLSGPVWNVMQRLRGTDGSVLARYQSLSVPIVLMPGLAPNSALPANQELKLDGSVTFGLHYF